MPAAGCHNTSPSCLNLGLDNIHASIRMQLYCIVSVALPAGCDRGERSSAAVQPVAGAERKHNRRGRERTLAERAAFLCSKVREAQAEVRDSAFYRCLSCPSSVAVDNSANFKPGRVSEELTVPPVRATCGCRALLACLDEAQASCQAGQGSLAPSPPGTACAEGERTAGVPGCEEDHSARRQPAAASPGRNGARSVHGSDQQQLPGDEAPGPSQPQVSADEAPVARTDQGHRQRGGAPDRSQPGPASEALAALEAQGQPQCGRTPSPSQPGFHSQAATAHADLRLDSASRRRLPTARSLCYSEGPAVLDERCIGSDADSAAADECRDGRNASPAANVVGCTCSGAGPARADEHSSASGAGPASAPESGCSGGRAPTPMAWRLDEAEALVVYGLGSLEGGPVPRYQLALALLLAARMPALRPPIEVSLTMAWHANTMSASSFCCTAMQAACMQCSPCRHTV